MLVQMNFGLIPGEVRMKQHKLTWITVIKIFVINLYHHRKFLAAPFDFTIFFTLAIFNRTAPFFTARLFLSIIVIVTKSAK